MNPNRRSFCLGRTIAAPAFFLALIAVSTLAAAQENEGIVVRGEGSATAGPTEVELSATVSGEAPLATDALVKFRDAKKRALAAITAMKNPNLSVESSGVSVNSGTMDANTQMMIMRGMAAPNTSQNVRLMETSRIILKHTDQLKQDELLEKLLKILDVAKDAGFQIGAAPPRNWYEMQMRAQEGDDSNGVSIAFKLPDASAVRDQAYQTAMADAKKKAQRLAELSGAKLGSIVSVVDEAQGMPQGIVGMATNRSVNGATTGKLTFHANLSVRFAIAK